MLKSLKLTLITLIILMSFQDCFAQHDLSTVRKIEKYLNSLHSLRANFKQEDSLGRHSYGNITILKPYNFKIETKGPSHNLIIGNKSLIIYHDYKMNQTSHASPEANIFDLLLRDDIELSNQQYMVKKLEVDRHNIELEIESNSRKEKSNLILIFDRDPIVLKQISTEKDGELTSMILYDTEANPPISEEEFKFEYLKNKKRYNRR